MASSETCPVVIWHDKWHSVGISHLVSLLPWQHSETDFLLLPDMDAELSRKGVETRGPSSCPKSTFAAEEAVCRGFSVENWECGADRMVKIELEAAEALAGLAHSAMHESETPRSKSGWNEGKPASQRVKSESPAGILGLNPQHSVMGNSDLAEDRAVVDAELPQPSSMCTISNASFNGSKSRQNLSEAEKEARRLRRVLANRESARKSILRRKALYEELTRKAADLAWENKNLKRDKELALNEYDSLKSTNEFLKARIAKTMKAMVEGTQKVSKSPHIEISTTPSTNCPILVHDQPPFPPFIWPSIIPFSNLFQSQYGSQDAINIPSKVPVPAIGKPGSIHEQENASRINGLGTPLYILPCSWFYPLPNHGNRLPLNPSLDLNDKLNETSMDNQFSASSSSKTITHTEHHHSSLPFKVKTDASTSTGAIPARNIHETPSGFPPNGGGQLIGPHPKGMFLMPTPLSAVRPAVTVKHENGSQLDYTPHVKAISSTGSHTVNALPEKNQEAIICNADEKLGGSVAAAEARKRRKEFTKLKNLHCRQLQMHC
ncbi:hypothetical protein F0562_016075 [Nyssa sinensis]|uniref:BZIP domain-containing protein n=1 Tax=Nyssa sinensis TaxID=561372 RepID=A0A5J4ZNF6_9ASTE|nr:hypothetical protein F0562_016075 [Nyssa sinensis]